MLFFTGDSQEKNTVYKEVKAEIAKAKDKYKEKIEKQYVNGDLRSAWQVIKSMASINQHTNNTKQLIRTNGVEDMDLANLFFSRFERSEFAQDVSRLRESLLAQRHLQISQEQANFSLGRQRQGKLRVLMPFVATHYTIVLIS